MLVAIDNQVYIFLCIVLGSMVIGLTYDLFRVARKAVKTNNVIVHFEDLIFWTIVIILIFSILFIFNAGEIRGYAIIGIGLGILIYEMLFSHYVVFFLIKIIDIFKRIIYYVYKLFKKPVIFLAKVIFIPIKYLFNLFKKVLKFIKKLNNLISYNIRINVKNIKNSIKKY